MKTLQQCSLDFSEAVRNLVLEIAYSLKIDSLLKLLTKWLKRIGG